MKLLKHLNALLRYQNVLQFTNKLNPKYLLSVKCSSYNLNLKLEDVSLNRYVSKLEKEYESLKQRHISNSRLLEIQPVIFALEERKSIVDSIKNLSELLNEKDAALKKLAQDELCTYEERVRCIDEELQFLLLPNDEDDHCNEVVLEVNAGVGGQEAMLFAKEMLEMYTNYAEYKGWDTILAEYNSTDIGGIRHASLIITGEEVFRHFKYEAGVHRVQRIPSTEKSGRIHTSTISVLALPQPDDIKIQLDTKDLKIETKRATGAGGQHVNTTDSAVRIVHLPTGIAIECQTDRSQIKNKQIAMQRLRAKLYEKQLEEQRVKLEATKRNQVRSNFRNEKIRTYNFGQDRITDHRLSGHNVHNLKGFMLGGEALDHLINKIDYHLRTEQLKQLALSV